MFRFGQNEKWCEAIKGLSLTDRVRVESSYTRRKYQAGHIIYAAGHPGDSVIIVESGRLRAYQADADGQDVTLCMLSAGYCTGLTSAISCSPRPLSVEAFEPASVFELDRLRLFTLMTEIPAFCINVTTLLASIAQEAVENSSWFVSRTAAQRLGHTLLALTPTDDSTPDTRTRVLCGVRHEQLASMVGVSRTWISLTLALLEDKSLIRRSRNRIEILDTHSLETYCARDVARVRKHTER